MSPARATVIRYLCRRARAATFVFARARSLIRPIASPTLHADHSTAVITGRIYRARVYYSAANLYASEAHVGLMAAVAGIRVWRAAGASDTSFVLGADGRDAR